MSNFEVFDRLKLQEMLDPFVPGMSVFITPIRYEALTPDLFALLFRTTGKAGEEHFFVLLEYDFLPDMDTAMKTISDWHGDILEFIKPDDYLHLDDPLDNYSYDYGKYKGLLAEVSRPAGKGYWATYIVIMPGDSIDEKLALLDTKQKVLVKKGLRKILSRAQASADKPFIETYTKYKDIEELKVNNSDYGFTVFQNMHGHWEFFYNHIPPRKPKR